MLYPIAILKGDDKTAHGIFFPDVPNLASACDDLQDIHKMALECLDVHFSDEKVAAHKSLYKSRSNYLAQLAMADLA